MQRWFDFGKNIIVYHLQTCLGKEIEEKNNLKQAQTLIKPMACVHNWLDWFDLFDWFDLLN